MRTLEAKYEIVTPMFIAGASKKAELRPPSFKGVLRFWYRAIALSFYNNNCKKVKEKEKYLFGSTDTGKSKVSVTIEHQLNHQIEKKRKEFSSEIAYIGYGTIGWNNDSKQNENVRPYIKENNSFLVKLVLRKEVSESEEDKKLLVNSLITMGLFGGMGSRSRKGFGSINLLSLKDNDVEIWHEPKDLKELEQQIKKLFKDIKLNDTVPTYSAFSKATSIYLSAKEYNNQLDLLNTIGKKMKEYRSINYKNDSNLIYGIIEGKKPDKHPRRVVFGLPHNYVFRNDKDTLIVNVNAKLSKITTRRASPLFIHIHKINGKYYTVFSLLKSEFLAKNMKIEMRYKKDSHTVPNDVDYSEITNFIESLDDITNIPIGGENN